MSDKLCGTHDVYYDRTGSLPLVSKQFQIVTRISPRKNRRIIRNNQGPNTQRAKRNESFTTINTVAEEKVPNSDVQPYKKLRV